MTAGREDLFESRAERDYDYFGKREVVRLRWRPKGSRGRWSKRIVIPDENHSVGEIMNRKDEYVDAIVASLTERHDA